MYKIDDTGICFPENARFVLYRNRKGESDVAWLKTVYKKRGDFFLTLIKKDVSLINMTAVIVTEHK